MEETKYNIHLVYGMVSKSDIFILADSFMRRFLVDRFVCDNGENTEYNIHVVYKMVSKSNIFNIYSCMRRPVDRPLSVWQRKMS